MTTLAVNVKRARTKAGLTQAQLANKAKTGRVHVTNIETGTATNPTLDLLTRLARACRCGVASLIPNV